MSRVLGKAGAAAAGFALLAGAVIAGASPAAAADNTIKNWNSDLCLGINGGGSGNGLQAIQWGCNGNPDQQWSFYSTGGAYYEFRNANNKCLGTRDIGMGADAIQWDCNKRSDQQWSITSLGNGGWKIMNKQSGYCLGIEYGSTEWGKRAVQWSCNGNDDQVWYFG